MIIRTLKGIVLSLLLHLLIFLLFFVGFPKIKVPPPSGKEQKISLNLSQFKIPPPAPKPVVVPVKPISVIPPMLKTVVKKPVKEVSKPTPVVKKKIIANKKHIFVEKVESQENNVTKTEAKKEKKLTKKKEKKKTQKKKVIKKKKITKKRVVRKKRKKSNNPLTNALMGSGTSMYPTQSRPASSGSNVAKMIKQLYGREFNGYSSTQKKFIKHNLGLIHRITQQTLWRNGYPETAKRTRQQGTNVVSFYLHPNGDISGLRLKKRIGYASLDKNTLEVIRIAYKNYPLPNQKTKIIFYVQYSIY